MRGKLSNKNKKTNKALQLRKNKAKNVFNNKKGQMGMIMGLMFLVMTIVVLTAFIPVIQNVIKEQRDQDNLNCVSSKNICGGAGDQTTCYNSTKESETTTCLIFSIYLPYIVIVVLVGGVAGLLYNRSQPQMQQGYGY